MIQRRIYPDRGPFPTPADAQTMLGALLEYVVLTRPGVGL